MEGFVNKIIEDELTDYATFVIIPIANPDAYSWGNAHVRPFGTKWDGLLEQNYVKEDFDPYDPEWTRLENGNLWYESFGNGVFKQDDVEAEAIVQFYKDLSNSGMEIKLLLVLHGDICPRLFNGGKKEGSFMYRPPGVYGYGRGYPATLDKMMAFADYLSDNGDDCIREWEDWPTRSVSGPYCWPSLPEFQDLEAMIEMEIDERVMYREVDSPAMDCDHPGETGDIKAGKWPVCSPERYFCINYHDTPDKFREWGGLMAVGAKKFIDPLSGL